MKESDDDESTPPTKCSHFSALLQTNPSVSSFPFIKPSLKGWICLKDGCLRKSGTHSTLTPQLQKMESGHRIMMEMGRLEIFCFECGLEITDDQEQMALEIRKLAIEPDDEQEKMLFGSSIEYPAGFQKQKAGIAGTVGSEFSSYLNSAIQLLAHIPPFYQICQDINQKTIKDPCLLQTIKCITKIRSGVYRIVDTKQVEAELLSRYPHFLKYSLRTPANFMYQILRAFSLEFQYRGFQCEAGKILQPSAQKGGQINEEIYSPMKELFAGQFIWHLHCQTCKIQKVKKAEFECLRLEHEDKSSSKANKVLQDLIENIFNFTKLFKNTFPNPETLACKQTPACSKLSLSQSKSHSKMPNILLLEFFFEEGISLEYPEILDLTKYAHSDEEYKYHYVGNIGRNNRRFYTHVKGWGGGRDWVFEDSLMREDGKRVGKAVNAVYKLMPKPRNRDLGKNVDSSILVDIQCYVPLPDFWSFYLTDLRRIQPLINPFICKHGYLAPQIKSKSSTPRKIPPSIYQFLVEQFGGLSPKIAKESHYCPTCLQRIQITNELKQSEREMAKFADQLSNKKSKVCVDLKWFESWKRYLYDHVDQPYGRENWKRPMPIDNKTGLNKDGEIDEAKYKKISQEVWYFFKKFYGGGPLIAKNPLPPSLALTQAIDLRYEKMKGLIKRLESFQ